MEASEVLLAGLERARAATLNTVKGLSTEQLGWRPGSEANSACFLLFHVFRTEDAIVARLTGGEPQFWEVGSWARRWTLPQPTPEASRAWSTGNSWTSAEVGAFVPPPLEDLLSYGEAVRARTLQTVRGMAPSRLEEEVRPGANVAGSLLTVIAHESQHHGQVDYLLGLMRSSGGG